MNKVFLTALLAASIVNSSAFARHHNACIQDDAERAQSDSEDAPVRYSSIVTAVHHYTAHGSDLKKGFNTIDGPVDFDCKSQTGCLVTALVYVEISTAFDVCMTVDGLPMHPSPSFAKGTGSGTFLEARKVEAGPHSVQFSVLLPSNVGNLYSWIAQYSMYEQ